jgi:hypothetical protein
VKCTNVPSTSKLYNDTSSHEMVLVEVWKCVHIYIYIYIYDTSMDW